MQQRSDSPGPSDPELTKGASVRLQQTREAFGSPLLVADIPHSSGDLHQCRCQHPGDGLATSVYMFHRHSRTDIHNFSMHIVHYPSTYVV